MSNTNTEKKTVTLIGGRGHVGQALIRLLDQHPNLQLSQMSSRQWQNQKLGDVISDLSEATASLVVNCFEAAQTDDYLSSDVLILALPNGLSDEWVNAAEANQYAGLILDLSTDRRFDKDWQYAITELYPANRNKAARISNPGCYATAMQLAVYPLREYLSGTAHCFGVSGFSGAGTNPSAYNNPDRLRDNLLPYKLTAHFHQKEVCEHLQFPIRFIPHVAQFFSGINMTVSAPIKEGVSVDTLMTAMQNFYSACPLVEVIDGIPEIGMVANTPKACIGGISIDEDTRQAVIICCIDNLQKGAASQAIQNINQFFEFAPTAGL